MNTLSTDQEQHYLSFLDEVKNQIRESRIRFARTVNKELIHLYWWIGKGIAEKQEQLGW